MSGSQPSRMTPVAAVVLDIEGTTTPTHFTHDVLLPQARAGLPALLHNRAGEPEVAAALAGVPGPDRLATLLSWMDRDEQAPPLKALQGILWRDAYASGAVRGALYPDVAACLRRWVFAGLRLFTYSSIPVEAQRLLFGHSVERNLVPLFTGFLDGRVGSKREASSYRDIATTLRLPGAEVLFLSSVEAELDAAVAAGLRACQVVRAEDGTAATARHPVAADLRTAGRQLGLTTGGPAMRGLTL